MSWNYWKCRVHKTRSLKRPWHVTVIETDAIVLRCGTFTRAIKRAIKFQAIQNRTNGKDMMIQMK